MKTVFFVLSYFSRWKDGGRFGSSTFSNKFDVPNYQRTGQRIFLKSKNNEIPQENPSRVMEKATQIVM